jgi:hypothetical protein
MSHIPDEAVPRGVEHVVEGECQLHRSQRGGQVASPLGDGIDHDLSDFISEINEFHPAKPSDILGEIDSGQNAFLFCFGHLFLSYLRA